MTSGTAGRHRLGIDLSGRSIAPSPTCTTSAASTSAQIHLRHIWPLPKPIWATLLKGVSIKVLLPEMNTGQLVHASAFGQYPDRCIGGSEQGFAGKPFKIAEVEEAIDAALAS